MGTVSTAGWTNARLEPRYYVTFPADGIQDFDFVATPPPGMAPMVICAATAQQQWDDPPLDIVKGVRVHAQAGYVETMLGGAKTVL